MSEQVTIEQRTEWLDDFNAARNLAQLATGGLRGLSATLYEVGSDKLVDNIGQYADVLTETIDTMNRAVSRMIHEDAQASWDQIGLTFKALLESSAAKEPSNEH